jgi:hypothetical protein
VWLETDDARNANITLSVRADVASHIILYPTSLDFGKLHPGLSEARTFTIRSNSGSPVEIRDIHTSDSNIKIRAEAKQMNGVMFTIMVDAPRIEGRRDGEIFVQTSESKNPLAIKIAYQARGAIEVNPRSFLFDFREDAHERTAIALIRVFGSSQITASLAEPSPFVNVKCEPTDGGARLTVQCKYSKLLPSVWSKTVRIVSGDDNYEVPVVVLR